MSNFHADLDGRRVGISRAVDDEERVVAQGLEPRCENNVRGLARVWFVASTSRCLWARGAMKQTGEGAFGRVTEFMRKQEEE